MAVKITKTRIALALGLAVLLTWIFFHPRRQAELEELTPAMLEIIANKPFGDRFDAKVRRVTLVSTITAGEEQAVETLQQSITLPAAGVTRKTTHYYSGKNMSAVQQEYTRLTVGTLVLLSHYRRPLPIVGDLLPYSFWATSRLRDLQIQKNTGFPDQPGGQFAATYVADEMHADGSLSANTQESIQCMVTGTRPASTFLASLKGEAVLFKCNSKVARKGNDVEENEFESAYFRELRWSFAYSQLHKNNVSDAQANTRNTLVEIE
jgi:hypothetical protein